MARWNLVVCSLASCLTLLASSTALAGKKVVVGTKAAPNGRVSYDEVDHQLLDALLKKYVDDYGDVDYATWQKSANDMRALDSYLGELSRVEPRWQATRPAMLAFWINAYNAVTIRGILREYPTSSIRNHTPRLYGYHIWKDLLLVVGDHNYSLEQIEHQILRKLDEPRVHFAIVCASKGCPRLLSEAYIGERLEEQLVANTRHFFAKLGNFRHDANAQTFHVSPIMKWFDEDFGIDQAARLKTIAPYLQTPAARQAALNNNVRVKYLDYDWSLNDQRAARR